MTLTPETTSTLSAGMPTYFDPKVIKTLEPRREMANLCTTKVIPANRGKIVSFLTYARISADPTALPEGTSPSSTALTTSAVTCQLSAWARAVEIEDFVVGTVVDPVVENTQLRLAEAGLDTIDILIRNEITANATAIYTGSVTALSAISSATTMSMGDVRKAVATLESNFADPMSDGYYHLVIHPYQKYDLMSATAVTEFHDIFKFTDTSPVKKAEIGTVYNTKVFMSQNVKTTTSGTSASARAVYAAIAGADALAQVSLKKGGGLIEKFYQEPQFGVADPGKQFHMVGVKIPFFVPKIIRPASIRQIITGSSL